MFVICNDTIISIYIIGIKDFINDHIKICTLILGVIDFINCLIKIYSTKSV